LKYSVYPLISCLDISLRLDSIEVHFC
jgi:hypothetical protein